MAVRGKTASRPCAWWPRRGGSRRNAWALWRRTRSGDAFRATGRRSPPRPP